MPASAITTAKSAPNVASRQLRACTSALPMRASHSCRARMYGVSACPPGIHFVFVSIACPFFLQLLRAEARVGSAPDGARPNGERCAQRAALAADETANE